MSPLLGALGSVLNTHLFIFPRALFLSIFTSCINGGHLVWRIFRLPFMSKCPFNFPLQASLASLACICCLFFPIHLWFSFVFLSSFSVLASDFFSFQVSFVLHTTSPYPSFRLSTSKCLVRFDGHIILHKIFQHRLTDRTFVLLISSS